MSRLSRPEPWEESWKRIAKVLVVALNLCVVGCRTHNPKPKLQKFRHSFHTPSCKALNRCATNFWEDASYHCVSNVIRCAQTPFGLYMQYNVPKSCRKSPPSSDTRYSTIDPKHSRRFATVPNNVGSWTGCADDGQTRRQQSRSSHRNPCRMSMAMMTPELSQ